MKSCYLFLLVFISESLSTSAQIKWPHGAKAAIVLSYDDGMQTHLSTAIPQLDQYELKGTFFINNITGRNEAVTWMTAARHGHELANHTLNHPCPAATGSSWPAHFTTEVYSVPRFINEIRITNDILKIVDPNAKYTTFAYPCNNTVVGKTDIIAAIKKSKLVKYARGGGTSMQIVTDFKSLQPLHVPSWPIPEGTSSDVLIEYATKVKSAGGLGIYQFHGIGGQWIKTSKEDHESLLYYLSQHKTEYWVATFREVMEYIEKNK